MTELLGAAMMIRATTHIRMNPYKPLVTSDLSAIQGKKAAQLYQYWVEKSADGATPQWSDFEFMDLYRIAPYMVALDVPTSTDRNELKYRFMGTEIVAFRSARKVPDLTGMVFGEGERVYDPQPMLDAYDASIKSGMPVVIYGEYQTDNSFGVHERLIAPWSIDGRVARLTTVLERHPKPTD